MSAELDIESILELDRPLFIDLRSPSEFLKGSIPGSVNIPLLDDQEREIIGLIYRQDQEKARLKGLSFVSPKLPEIAAYIQSARNQGNPVLYCWRGGMRSKNLYNLLAGIMESPVYRLEGGYKAYRNYILNKLQSYKLPMPLFVLNGLTGTGKTELLGILKEMGAPVLDLEGLACHRGSAFGHLGLPGSRRQKDFDGLLWNSLNEFKDSGYLIVEGEGKRIGAVHLPDTFYQAILAGKHILVTSPLAVRAARLLQEYTPETAEQIEAVVKAIQSLQKYLGQTKVDDYAAMARKKDFPALVSQLCINYYDRLYSDAKPGNTPFILEVDSSYPQEAAQKILTYIKEAIK